MFIIYEFLLNCVSVASGGKANERSSIEPELLLCLINASVVFHTNRRTVKILLRGLNIICPNETCRSQVHKMILP